MNKKKIYNLIILDESGSMEAIKEPTIAGFNEVVQTIKGLDKPEHEQLVSLITFNSLGIREHLDKAPAKELREMKSRNFKPDACTPLLDAMGFSLTKLNNDLNKEKDYHVLVTILTDGEENDSKEFDGRQIRHMVEKLEKKNWTFTYIGANQNLLDIQVNLSIKNVYAFTANEADMKNMWEKEKKARINFNNRLNKNQDLDKNKGYFDE